MDRHKHNAGLKLLLGISCTALAMPTALAAGMQVGGLLTQVFALAFLIGVACTPVIVAVCAAQADMLTWKRANNR